MIERWTTAMRRAGTAGFSTVQMIVTVVILGLLAAVVVYAVSGTDDAGESVQPKSIDVEAIDSAEVAYRAANGRYGTEAELVDGGFLDKASGKYDVAVDVKGDYVISCVQPNCGSPASYDRIRRLYRLW